MTYYNPKIYNFANLLEEDKRAIKIAIYSSGDLSNVIEQTDAMTEGCTPLNAVANMYTEVAILNAKQVIIVNLIELMVNLIDSYDEDEVEIKIYDTSDYFFGLDDKHRAMLQNGLEVLEEMLDEEGEGDE